MSDHIRPHTLQDSNRIGEILADGWARAYGGFLPPEVLAPRIDRAARRKELHDFLSSEFDAAGELLLVSESNGMVVGFVHAILGDKGGLGTGGYVSLLYVDETASGQGRGRALLAAAAEWLGAHTKGPVAIAAFEDNPFHGVYAHLGGEIAKRYDVEVGGTACRSIIYLWADAATLREHALGGRGRQGAARP